MDKHCCICEWDEICNWRYQDERGNCDKWMKEKESHGEINPSEK